MDSGILKTFMFAFRLESYGEMKWFQNDGELRW